MNPKTILTILAASLAVPAAASAGVLDKQRLLEAETWLENRDWDWYKANIPFFECPDPDIQTTYYYRWELVTRHATYGSPQSGWSFTEFTDRPFWSGAYGAISCPVGHQLYEVRWLADASYARDYSRYWFRTPGAQPRNYGCWLADGIQAADDVHPDEAFMKDILPDLVRNYEAWEKRQFVPEVGLFWQNGHDDGMEFNINSRQTTDILRGAPGFRPGFNAYMHADALAIARTARLAGDTATAEAYEKKAASLKANVHRLLWDPKREFFFPMSMREEKDKEGNVVAKHTLTYQSGKHAGSPHGRELHGYIPWQFGMAGPEHGGAWKFLMDRNYFMADFGPTSVERHDPLFLLQKSCCWWSGQSWPYATAQTLKALANLLQDSRQETVTRQDYATLLRIFAKSHRKDGRPYLAEALHPDTGSFEGHDGYNHSEHYFHSSFNDLVITGLVGLRPRGDDSVEVKPLAPADWAWWALDDVSIRGVRLTILWDRDGSRYGRGAGLRVLADGKELASAATAASALVINLPRRSGPAAPAIFNYAVNNDGDWWPRFTATHTADKTSLTKLCDGQAWYSMHPPNRWTSEGSATPGDTVTVAFGMPRPVDTVKLHLLDDGKGVTAPASYRLEWWNGSAWQEVPGQVRTPEMPTGRRANVIRFPQIAAEQLRVTFTHGAGGRTGLTEFEAWGPGRRPWVPAPPPPGNLAINQTGEGFPKASASFHDVFGGVPRLAHDGRTGYLPVPVNRWTCYGSPTPSDWLEIDFGKAQDFRRIEMGIFDDRGGVQAPESYKVEWWDGSAWREAANQQRSPDKPLGGAVNRVTFDKVTAAKVRVVFTHKGQAKSGVTEIEVRND